MTYQDELTAASGKGYAWAEPEAFVEFSDRVLLIEAKLTGGTYGKDQMEKFYKPLLEALIGKPVVCLLVCRNRTVGTPGPFYGEPEYFLQSEAKFGTWHFLG